MNRKDLLEQYRCMASFEDFDIGGFDESGIDDDTPLHAAAYSGRLEDLKLMIDEDTDLDIRGDIGNTPLHCAAIKRHVDVVRFLLIKGASYSDKNDYGDLPVDMIGNDLVLKKLLS